MDNLTDNKDMQPEADYVGQFNSLCSYFPEMTEIQLSQMSALYELYSDWNSKINVISRKDIGNLYLHHVLHSLGISKMLRFKPGSQIMDLGTGLERRTLTISISPSMSLTEEEIVRFGAIISSFAYISPLLQRYPFTLIFCPS